MPGTVLGTKDKAMNNIAKVSWHRRASGMIGHGIPLSTDHGLEYAALHLIFLSNFIFFSFSLFHSA